MSTLTTPLLTPPREEHPRKRRSLLADVERELRVRRCPYVAVNEAKKALFAHSRLKSFHLVVYDKERENWLLWCGDPTAAVRQDMAEWAQVFGEGFQVVYAVRRKGEIVYKTSSGARLTLNGDAPNPTLSASRPNAV
jgi:hypothetical protein